jgi:PIN domain nuclease of toxin-antitoxin system
LAALKPAIAVDCNSLAGRWHGDPADRIIAATARSEGLSLVTCDRQVLDCVAQGYVGALPRSDA